MSEKDFDNRMRKKFDSLKADYPPEAWENFKKLLPVPWYVTFFKTYGGWIFGGLSSLALLFNILLNPKDPEFEETNTITKVEVPTIVTETVFKTDTVVKYVYLTKYIDRDNSLNLSKQEHNSLERSDKEISALNGDLNSTAVAKNVEKNKEPEIDLVSKEEARLEEISPEKERTLAEKVKKEMPKDSSSEVLAERKAEKQSTFWQNLNIRPGVEVDYFGRKCFSYGIFAEVFLRNRFSITTGISISNSNPATFNFPKEFNKFTGKDFEDVYKPPKPSTGPTSAGIKDISIETSRIRMPIYMTYYVPITYSLDFLISAGTRLDLKVSENVSYTNEGFGNSPFRSFENPYKPKVFNNLYYGMGVQYRYGRVYGQLTPYFEFPFSKPNYMISPNKFGINAALKFSLK
jgi:hypothetical protein